MREVEAPEAQNTLDALLDLVQQGEQIVITSQDRPVARLVPVDGICDESAAMAAVERIRARARARISSSISVQEWMCFRDEGR